MANQEYCITGPPAAMYYVPDFLTQAEEQVILDKIPANRWTTLSHRRLQAVPTQLATNNTLLASALPEWLRKPAVQRIEALGFFEDAPHGINHCLINEYLPGQGIMPHEDGAAYYPVVATVSLGGTLVLDVFPKPAANLPDESRTGNAMTEDETKPWRIVQEPRSLLVTTGVAYADTLHGIAEIGEDVNLEAETVANWNLLRDRGSIEAADGRNTRSKRVSLTFRDVKRVSNLGSRLLGNRRP